MRIFTFDCATGGEPLLGTTCDHCPPGAPCNPQTGACGKGKIVSFNKPYRNTDSAPYTLFNLREDVLLLLISIASAIEKRDKKKKKNE